MSLFLGWIPASAGMTMKGVPARRNFSAMTLRLPCDGHNPPHFHVRYNEHRATVGIRGLNVAEGHLPARVRGLVIEWAELHQSEPLAMWTSRVFRKIAPLV
jgi:hypothetical protein